MHFSESSACEKKRRSKRTKNIKPFQISIFNASEGAWNEIHLHTAHWLWPYIKNLMYIVAQCTPLTEAMRNGTRKKKYFSTFQLSTPRKVMEMELQLTTWYWIHTEAYIACSSSNPQPSDTMRNGTQNWWNWIQLMIDQLILDWWLHVVNWKKPQLCLSFGNVIKLAVSQIPPIQMLQTATL